MRTRRQHPFDRYVQQPETAIRLTEAALLFAIDRYPQLALGNYLSRLDGIARRVESLPPRSPLDQVRALQQVLVEEQGLRGNAECYYDPRNSYLNDVLDRGKGIPISLSIVWIDVCQQLEWPFLGIGLPGHFIVGYADAGQQLWVDPFAGGRVLGRADCESLVTMACGRAASLEDTAFTPSPPKAILRRMLNNLRVIYYRQQAWHFSVDVIRRLAALDPHAIDLEPQLQVAMRRLASYN